MKGNGGKRELAVFPFFPFRSFTLLFRVFFAIRPFRTGFETLYHRTLNVLVFIKVYMLVTRKNQLRNYLPTGVKKDFEASEPPLGLCTVCGYSLTGGEQRQKRDIKQTFFSSLISRPTARGLTLKVQGWGFFSL